MVTKISIEIISLAYIPRITYLPILLATDLVCGILIGKQIIFRTLYYVLHKYLWNCFWKYITYSLIIHIMHVFLEKNVQPAPLQCTMLLLYSRSLPVINMSEKWKNFWLQHHCGNSCATVWYRKSLIIETLINVIFARPGFLLIHPWYYNPDN